ncbi:MAG: SDR family oxidoreductase [Rickettsiales bacterium]|nr:SDR family oxidoreductase [Rickettsiales bacterium]
MRMKDRVAIITGASRGVGAACALALAREGCNIVAAAKTIEPHPKLPGTLHDTVASVEAAGARAIPVQMDVRFPEQVDAMVDQAMEVFGRVDYLINNAGAIFWSPVEHWTAKKFDLVMDVNVRGAFLCSRAVLPIMKKQGFGHILMMSPPEHPETVMGKAPYMVSKLGMTMLARAIAEENADDGIASYALWPITGIRTADTENLSMGKLGEWRTPEILADATRELLLRDPSDHSFKAWLDEDILAEAGITDLRPYRCDPDVEPTPMSIQLVDPSWTR